MRRLLLLALMAPSVALAGGGLPKLCASFFSLEHVRSDRTEGYRERWLKAKSYEEIITLRYLTNAPGLAWDWRIRTGVLRITFPPNRREYNDHLLAVASVLAFAYDGREYYLRESKTAPATVQRPRPSFHLALESRPAKSMEDFAQTASVAERSLVQIATLEVTNSPVGEPAVHFFEGFKGLLHEADRFAFLMARPEFLWLELRTTPAELKRLRQRVRRHLWTYREPRR